MIHLHTFLGAVPLLLLVSCSSLDPDDIADRAPWAEATFLDPLTTTISFTNGDTVSHDLRVKLFGFREDLNRAVPDSLAVGETYKYTVQIHRPFYVFYGSGYRISMRLLLPGKSRYLVYGESSISETGPFATEYNYIDEVLMPLKQPGRTPGSLENVTEYHQRALSIAQQHFDTIPRTTVLPGYVVPMLEDAIRAGAYHEALSIRGYYMFFYGDTIQVSERFIDSAQSFLARSEYNLTPQYVDLQESLARVIGISDHDSKHESSRNNANAVTKSYLSQYLDADRQYDAVATHLVSLITNEKMHLGKMENIESLYAILPPHYQKALDGIEQEAIDRTASLNGLADFMKTPLLTSSDEKRQPNTLSEKPLRLLKFWFAGCYPCLIEQPHEQELLAAYPDVDLIYINYSTSKDVWLEYLKKHQPPAHFQLHIPGMRTKLVRSAAGTTGAPTYLMVDMEGETVCRPCPKPSDPLLGEIIEEELRKESL
jgi:thiol-disulfide isomerase/thioredoxin